MQLLGGRPLIACALAKERRFLARRLTQVTVLKTGLGVERTTAALERYLHQKSPGCLIFTGTAGQLDPEVAVGQVVAPRCWIQDGQPPEAADVRLMDMLRQGRRRTVELGLTVSAPVIRPATRTRLYRSTGAQICDMESFAALEVARRHRLPALAVKVVSDGADSDLLNYFRDFSRHMAVLASCLDDLLQAIGKCQWAKEDHSA